MQGSVVGDDDLHFVLSGTLSQVMNKVEKDFEMDLGFFRKLL